MACDLRSVGRAVTVALLVIHALSGTAMAAKHRSGRSAKRAAHAHKAETAETSPLYAAIVVDANKKTILHMDKADELRRPASLTKVMTLYLLFEALEAHTLTLESELPVSTWASVQEATKLDLEPGTTLLVQDAILGLVTHSANDAAVVVAEALAGSESAFAEKMTQKARALGMNRTVYRNASGLPDDAQYSTARDQAILGLAVQRRFPNFYHYFSTTSFEFQGKNLRNHNKLLTKVEGMDGIKTGYTRASKFNLMASIRRNGRHIVAVVLGGPTARSRDNRMRTLIEQYLAGASPSIPSGELASTAPARE